MSAGLWEVSGAVLSVRLGAPDRDLFLALLPASRGSATLTATATGETLGACASPHPCTSASLVPISRPAATHTPYVCGVRFSMCTYMQLKRALRRTLAQGGGAGGRDPPRRGLHLATAGQRHHRPGVRILHLQQRELHADEHGTAENTWWGRRGGGSGHLCFGHVGPCSFATFSSQIGDVS